MKPFLDCNIWFIFEQEPSRWFVEKVFPYVSNTTELIHIPKGVICVPEFLIRNLKLLQNLDFVHINTHRVSIIKQLSDLSWEINLEEYNNSKL